MKVNLFLSISCERCFFRFTQIDCSKLSRASLDTVHACRYYPKGFHQRLRMSCSLRSSRRALSLRLGGVGILVVSHPVAAICIALGQHTRAGIEDNLWNTTKGRRMTSIQMIEKHVRMARELGRAIAMPGEGRVCECVKREPPWRRKRRLPFSMGPDRRESWRVA